MKRRPLRIGLTGGIGSGKSTIAGMFAALGVPVFDADQIAHELTVPGQPAVSEIRSVFGDSILRADHSLDRSRLREQVFSDVDKRRQLEAILHPRVYHALEQFTEQATEADYVVWVVPLLLETDAAGRVDRILVVDCPEPLQIARAASREGLDERQVKDIMQHQLGRIERLRRADDTIVNDGELDKTREQVAILHESYLRQAAERDVMGGYSSHHG